jgi:hypothetical protein
MRFKAQNFAPSLQSSCRKCQERLKCIPIKPALFYSAKRQALAHAIARIVVRDKHATLDPPADALGARRHLPAQPANAMLLAAHLHLFAHLIAGQRNASHLHGKSILYQQSMLASYASA